MGPWAAWAGGGHLAHGLELDDLQGPLQPNAFGEIQSQGAWQILPVQLAEAAHTAVKLHFPSLSLGADLWMVICMYTTRDSLMTCNTVSLPFLSISWTSEF